ncbi:3'-5' exonuclease [Aquiflexum gelatinilyticum]|uniref:3'-5' exonuclease n=1 Tax=Aquiflexum gelatinilyticum TaxID=2961943 RepID=UPI0021685FD2|nr:3'-5' exonuclease [Aquiflexum gelatinilyticum]MCS4435131.1 3'-5' exonuclease [Aquiflexum gelatinilyticum]
MGNFLSELGDVLFLDIETASLESDFKELPPRLQEEWLKKEKHIMPKEEEGEPGSLFFQKAGIFAEFGKVICVGVGYFHYLEEENKLEFRTKSYGEELEYDTLTAFCELLQKKKWVLCAHNGKEFDFPYLSRRILINRIPLPEPLQIAGKKPWEVRHLDTLELWKFGDYKHYTRLELLAAIFDIPTSKESIDGSQVNEAYYIQKDLESIRKYCLRDVVVTAQIYLAFQGLPPDIEMEVINKDNER